MQKIYIEITNLTEVRSLTGIQRVEKSVALEMYKMIREQLCFVVFKSDSYRFEMLDTDLFIDYLKGDKSAFDKMFSGKFLVYEEMKPGDIFFEVDAVWNGKYKSSVLLPKLKRYGVKIACYVYDIIPITHPSYSHFNTRFNFINYIGAYLQYADILIASAQSTLDEINDLSDKLGIPRVKGYVSWLGSDFKAEKNDGEIPEEVIEAAKNKYILNVGTIEPRKNHDFLLDAFESGLADKGFNLIFAGKIGWNVKELEERIENHPLKDKSFFYFKGLNDASIDYLYKHAFLIAFPSKAEGFGLPIIESLQRGTPVLTSDIPVLREVGGEYCKYFKLNDIASFNTAIDELTNDPKEYKSLLTHIKDFKPFTWKETAERIVDALNTLKPEQRKAKKDVSQMVILTARVEDIKNTLPYIEAYMPFIKKVLLCCPDKVSDEMKAIPVKRITIDTLTDGEILKGRALPEDHGTRNFFLRCLAMGSDKVDDVFIMSDDDYRPLKTITPEVFIDNDSYVAYYCHELNEWKGVVGALSSYDHYIYRTRDFVNKHRYPGFQYSSHMPQIIEKELYQRMIKEHPGIESTGLDEWSSYFNFVQANYQDLIKSKPYICMCWPGMHSDWNMRVKPNEYLFENYYEFLYKDGNIFDGMSQEWNDKTEEENKIKIEKYTKYVDEYFEWKKAYEEYSDAYIKDRLEIPSFAVFEKDGNVEIAAPKILEVKKESIMHIPFMYKGKKDGLKLSLSIEANKIRVANMEPLVLSLNDLAILENKFEVAFAFGPKGTPAGNYTLIVSVDDGNSMTERKVLLKLS